MKSLFGTAFPHVVRRYRYGKGVLRGSRFALNSLDKKLEKYLDFDGGFYVELGANDGVSQSNSLYFERKRQWKGVLVEPSPHNFLVCKQYRGSNNSVFCNACVSFDFEGEFVKMKYADLMSVSLNMVLDIEDVSSHIAKGEQFLEFDEGSFEFGAVAITLNELLNRASAPSIIDFLSLDVEGAELEVLKGIDFGAYCFRYMLIELRDLERVEAYLRGFSYFLVDKFSSHDYLFEYRKVSGG